MHGYRLCGIVQEPRIAHTLIQCDRASLQAFHDHPAPNIHLENMEWDVHRILSHRNILQPLLKHLQQLLRKLHILRPVLTVLEQISQREQVHRARDGAGEPRGVFLAFPSAAWYAIGRVRDGCVDGFGLDEVGEETVVCQSGRMCKGWVDEMV